MFLPAGEHNGHLAYVGFAPILFALCHYRPVLGTNTLERVVNALRVALKAGKV